MFWSIKSTKLSEKHWVKNPILSLGWKHSPCYTNVPTCVNLTQLLWPMPWSIKRLVCRIASHWFVHRVQQPHHRFWRKLFQICSTSQPRQMIQCKRCWRRAPACTEPVNHVLLQQHLWVPHSVSVFGYWWIYRSQRVGRFCGHDYLMGLINPFFQPIPFLAGSAGRFPQEFHTYGTSESLSGLLNPLQLWLQGVSGEPTHVDGQKNTTLKFRVVVFYRSRRSEGRAGEYYYRQWWLSLLLSFVVLSWWA